VPDKPPVLSVGMPVYNGAATLEAALRSVLSQTVSDLEVIISDNGSTDGTPDICARMMAEDKRIIYVRHEVTLPITANFSFVLHQARAPYFMWAAHDDMREPDMAARLIAGLKAAPSAVLAFGDVVELKDGVPTGRGGGFDTRGKSNGQRLRQTAFGLMFHIYGVWRTDAAQQAPIRATTWWADTPFMMAASQLGDFIHVPGPKFIYRFNPRPFFAQPQAGLLARKIADVLKLPVLCGLSVATVAGPLRGLEAFGYGCLKIAGQAGGFILRRLTGRQGV
jgi:glycosyltransferase involved in cell wall biosynthesis